MKHEIRVLDGTTFYIDVEKPRNGRVAFAMSEGGGGCTDMTAIDALTLAVALLAAVEQADPPLAPRTFKELQKLIGSVQWKEEVERMRHEDEEKP